MKNSRKRQRGGDPKFRFRLNTPIFEDIYQPLYQYERFSTKEDRQLGRLNMYMKVQNMKDLVSWIYLGKGDVVKAFAKSDTPIISQIGKRYITNRYSVPDWFDKNFITRDQIKDYYKGYGKKYFYTIGKYLKQLYILITGSKDGFDGFDQLKDYPVIGTPSESFRSKLAQIFGEDVMDRFVENYNDVKGQIEEVKRNLVTSATSDSAAGNPLDNVAGNTHAFHADNVAGNDNAWDPDNLAYDAHYAEIEAKRGIMGGTRRRRRNKSNKRRRTSK